MAPFEPPYDVTCRDLSLAACASSFFRRARLSLSSRCVHFMWAMCHRISTGSGFHRAPALIAFACLDCHVVIAFQSCTTSVFCAVIVSASDMCCHWYCFVACAWAGTETQSVAAAIVLTSPDHLRIGRIRRLPWSSHPARELQERPPGVLVV